MTLEHSPARQRRRGASFNYELLTFDDVAERLHCARKTVKQILPALGSAAGPDRRQGLCSRQRSWSRWNSG